MVSDGDGHLPPGVSGPDMRHRAGELTQRVGPVHDRPDGAGVDHRRQGLETALRLADEGGIDALSMRKLGQALGVEAMAVYYHLANKDEVLDGIVDLVFAEIDLPVQGARGRRPCAGAASRCTRCSFAIAGRSG